VRLVFVNKARRFVGLVALLFFALPLGLSVTGCGHKAAAVVYCNAGDSGPVVGQVANIILSPSLATTGESLNYGQMGQALSASAIDCHGNSVSVKSFVYSSTSSFSNNTNNGPIIADINPSNGQVCAGTWNRNTGGGIADYTTCFPPTFPSGASTTPYLAYVTASAIGASGTSNAIPVYIHPIVTGVLLGPKTNNCSIDPGTDCCPNDTVGTPVPTPAGVVDGSSCISQNQVGQLVARIYQNGGTTGDTANNITCQVGHVAFGSQTGGIVSIDENGAATAQMPGSTTITATISNSSTATNAGFFSTCPPASISLVNPNDPSSSSVNVAINTKQPLTATVLDTQGNPITGLALEYNSTTPQTITPSNTGLVTPYYPGSADITAVCQPSVCNPSAFSQIGYLGNGKAITSNPITINAAGRSSTVLYMGSTSSLYVAFKDFTTNQTSTLIRLPFLPNSMVMRQDGTEIYLGSPQGLMSIGTASNTVSAANQNIPGVVLAVSPDGSTIVVTDPTRQTISLVSATNSTILTTYGGIGTSATWSPDSQAVYITTATLSSSATPAAIAALTAAPTIQPSSIITPSPIVLTHSTFTDWQTATGDEGYSDTAVAVPSIGAFFAGPSNTEARSYCPSSTITGTALPPNVTNTFIPLAALVAAQTDQIAATNDSKHILGAHANGTASTLSDIDLTLPTPAAACPAVIPPTYFTTAFPGPQTLTGINAATITSVVPDTNSAVAFVTYTMPTGATTGGQLLPMYFPPASGNGTLQFLTLGNGATAASAPVSGVFSTDNFTFYAGTGAADGTNADNDVHLITMTYPATGVPTATELPGDIISPQLPLVGSAGDAPVNLIAQHPKKTTN
jgi:hypothetical protein